MWNIYFDKQFLGDLVANNKLATFFCNSLKLFPTWRIEARFSPVSQTYFGKIAPFARHTPKGTVKKMPMADIMHCEDEEKHQTVTGIL